MKKQTAYGLLNLVNALIYWKFSLISLLEPPFRAGFPPRRISGASSPSPKKRLKLQGAEGQQEDSRGDQMDGGDLG